MSTPIFRVLLIHSDVPALLITSGFSEFNFLESIEQSVHYPLSTSVLLEKNWSESFELYKLKYWAQYIKNRSNFAKNKFLKYGPVLLNITFLYMACAILQALIIVQII